MMSIVCTLFIVFMILGWIDELFTEIDLEKKILMGAVKLQNLELIKELLVYGVDVNTRDQEGRTPLHLFRFEKDNGKSLEILKTLMDYGASLTLLDKEGKSAFGYLFCHADKKAMQILLQYDIDLFVKDHYGCTQLYYLTYNIHKGVIELFQDKQFDINARGMYDETLLLSAVRNTNINQVQFLLEHGADTNLADDLGYTPLESAVGKKNIKIIELLLYHGVDAQQLAYDEFGVNPLEDDEFLCGIETVLAHLALIESQGQILTVFTRSQINSLIVYQDYFAECQHQLEELKNITVYESVTLYKLLTESPNRIALYTVNPGFSSKFKALVKSMFYKVDLYYYHTLLKQVGKATSIAQNKLTNAVVVSEVTGFDINAHRIIVTRIADYLEGENLKELHCTEELFPLDEFFHESIGEDTQFENTCYTYFSLVYNLSKNVIFGNSLY